MSRRRDELLAIAAELFAARGVGNVTMDDIGEAAGISGPALYHHFEGKEAMLGEMLTGVSRSLLDGGRAVVEECRRVGDDAAVTLGCLVDFHCRFAVDDPQLITVHFRDLVHASDHDQADVRRFQARYAALWVHELERRSPTIERRRAQAAVHAAFGLINSTPFSARLPRDQMIPLLRDMATGALGACLGAM